MLVRVAGMAGFALLFAVAAFSSVATAEEGCAISGRVVDEKGTPVPSAAVTALPKPLTQAVLGPTSPANGAIAGRRGEYCVPRLPVGEYYIRAIARTQPASASPACDSCCRPGTEFGITFFRHSSSRERATPVSVGNRQHPSGVELVMRRMPAYCVRGEVRDQLGALLSNVAIALETESWSAGVLNEGGRFLLTSLPPGAYTVVISDRPQLGRVLVRREIHVLAENIAGLVITVSEGSL